MCAPGRLSLYLPDEVEFELSDEVAAEPFAEVSVFLSIFKFDRMEWALEKLTELGVSAIIPVIARRTESHLAQAAAKRVERWRKIVREASQQSRRPAPPDVQDPVALRKAMQEVNGCRIVLSEVEEQASLKSVLASCQPPVTLAIGPEGGWTNEELELSEPVDGFPPRWAIRFCALKQPRLRRWLIVMSELSSTL